MYKVMIVDDETKNFQLFEKLVSWKEKGFEIAAAAADGLEALEKYDETKPDLIFMDIQLPLMDGLECIRHIRKEDEKVRIVIVSAYGDFSYAQKAIQYGVQDFLLKPVSRLMLNQLVDKMKTALDNETVVSEKSTIGKRQIRYLEQIVRGERSCEEEMERSFQEMNCCGLLMTDGNGSCLSDGQRRNLLEELLKSETLLKYSAIEYSPDSGYSVLLWKKKEPMEEFVEAFQAAAAAAGYLCQVYLYESKRGTLGEWLKKFIGIENYGFYELKSGTYKLEESPFSEEDIRLPSLEHLTAKAIADGSCQELLELLDRIFQEAAEKKINPQILKDISLDCLVRIKFILKKLGQQESFSLMRNVRMESIHNMQNAGQLQVFVKEKVASTFADMNTLLGFSEKKLVLRANAFTDISYQDVDFSVQKVADHIGMSKNYFTSQYKELTGTGFWEYVTKLRMEKAKELLIMTDEMVGTIAHGVGYESEYHFSRKFKEYTGQSPKNFRKSVKNSKS